MASSPLAWEILTGKEQFGISAYGLSKPLEIRNWSNKIMKNQKGFSLVELLVVVIIIAIIAAIAIPSLLASRRAANEASAISSLRTIHSAQATYFGTTGANANYSATLGALAGDGLIDTTLGTGTKSGYTYTMAIGTGVYAAEGHATTQGSTGTRYFGVSHPGVIFQGNALFTTTSGALGGGGSTAAIQ